MAVPRGCPKKGVVLVGPGWFWTGEAKPPDEAAALEEDATEGGIAGMDMAPNQGSTPMARMVTWARRMAGEGEEDRGDDRRGGAWLGGAMRGCSRAVPWGCTVDGGGERKKAWLRWRREASWLAASHVMRFRRD